MGLFNFVKDAGEKLWDAVTGNHDKDDLAKKVQDHLHKTGIPSGSERKNPDCGREYFRDCQRGGSG